MWFLPLMLFFAALVVHTADDVTLYHAPAANADVVAVLPAGTPLDVHGRTDTGYWLDVSAGDDVRGWLYFNHLPPTTWDSVQLVDLPVVAQQVTILDDAPFPLAYGDDDTPAQLERLAETPILHNFDSPRLADIYATGQAQGNNTGIFIKIGDSNSTTGDFLRPFGMPFGGCNYGAFDHLQDTVTFFSAQSPYPGFRNAFDSTNVTAQNGLNTFGLFDSFWADGEQCRAGEHPLACEYRVLQPSVALTMIGLMDLEQIPIDTYQRNLDEAVDWLIERGVIPVLSTFPVLPDYPRSGRTVFMAEVRRAQRRDCGRRGRARHPAD